MLRTPRGAAAVWAALAAVLALFLGLTAALAFNQPATAGLEATDSTEIRVELTEFGIEPREITVPPATPVTLRVVNAGAIDHDLHVDGIAATPMLAGGEEAVLSLPALDAGTYRVWCEVAGHAAAGMEGTLVVGEEGDGHAVAARDKSLTPEEMAQVHEKGVAEFPVETEGRGGLPLEPVVEPDGTKVFELTASEIEWETEPGVWKSAMAYNDMVPGPRIDVDLGDRVRVVLHNELPEPTTLHLHGLLLPADMDGVPGLSQPSVLPGESFTYEFTVRNTGSHMYHSHFDSVRQVPMGLLGAFIVHGEDEPEVDVDYVMVINDGPLGYTLNGKGFPATEPIVVPFGQTVRVRYMNEGLQIHPMHLHGIPQTMIARDGYPLPEPYMLDTVNVAPGERIDVLIDATEPGAWAWHCHILSHAEGPDGMFGMVTALVVTE
jgi:manganese oxidase